MIPVDGVFLFGWISAMACHGGAMVQCMKDLYVFGYEDKDLVLSHINSHMMTT